MLITLDFYTVGRWTGILTIIFAVITVLGFILQWGVRFRLVGVTGFTAVLTGGLFSLYLGLPNRTVIPGTVHYSLLYDTGATQVVIGVPITITESQLEATLRQAAADLFSYGRLGQAQNQLTIRARTVVHPEPGASKPLYLGQVNRSLATRTDDQLKIEIYPDKLAQLPQPEA